MAKLILNLTLLVLLTACKGRDPVRRDPVRLNTQTQTAQQSVRTMGITERFENKLAEKLLHLAFQEISNNGASNKFAIIDIHHRKLHQSIEVTKLSASNQLHLRLLDYLWESERSRVHISESGAPVSYAEKLRLETSLYPDLEDFTALAYEKLSSVHADIRLLSQPDQQTPIATYFRTRREDHENALSNTNAGRQRYLDLLVDSLLTIEKFAPSLVGGDLIGLESEEFTVEGVEKSPGRIFSYRTDNKMLSIDLGDMSLLPLYETESLAIYYGMPGMYAISSRPLLEIQSLISIPGYSEGWAAYITANLGHLPAFQHPDTVLSHLYFEAMTISLAIADILIHTENWSDDQAMEFVTASSPYPLKRLQRSVEFARKKPCAFSAPLLARLQLEKLQEQSRQILKQNFDLNEFHHAVLKPGPLPFIELERVVKDWTNRKKIADHRGNTAINPEARLINSDEHKLPEIGMGIDQQTQLPSAVCTHLCLFGRPPR
ncbi:MAG: hypothetical protein CMQ20_01725 [Gammaproteobacteria bacterium]|nr:hypothetical protein [Gammaproteobacteria bacterium]